MSTKTQTPAFHSSVKLEIDPITKQQRFFAWREISYSEYITTLEKELDDLLGQAKFITN